MERDKQIIMGIFALLIGFYVLMQNIIGGQIIGLILIGIGLYWIISKI